MKESGTRGKIASGRKEKTGEISFIFQVCFLGLQQKNTFSKYIFKKKQNKVQSFINQLLLVVSEQGWHKGKKCDFLSQKKEEKANAEREMDVMEEETERSGE